MRRVVVSVMVICLLAVMMTAAGAQTRQEVDTLKRQMEELQKQMEGLQKQLEALQAEEAPPEVSIPDPVAGCWTDRITINGFFHNMYAARKDTSDDFFMRRLYVNMIANLSSSTTSVVTLARVGPSDPNIDLANAFVDYKFKDNWMVRFGQVPTYFGLDTYESSSRIIPLERFVATEGIPSRPDRPGLPGLYFQGPWDRGFYVSRLPQGKEPMVVAGLVNGNFRNSDDNNNRTWSLDLKWDRDWGRWGASYMDGKYGPTGSETDRKALGLYFRTEPKPWGFQSEYVRGSFMGSDIDGWYVQAAYRQGRNTPYFRYQKYDPDKDTSGDTFKGWHLGINHQLTRNNRLTLEYSDADRSDIDYGQLALQWELCF